jgi:hypothetical protein
MTNSQLKTRGLVRTIVPVVLLTIVLGVAAGWASATLGIPPAIAWAVLVPNAYFVMLLLNRRRPTPDDELRQSQVTETVLLNATNTGRRLVQTIIQLAGILLGAAGVGMLFRESGGPSSLAVSTTLIGLAILVIALLTVIRWDVSYKGHTIRFENHPCFAERLYIDGEIVARGGLGVHMVLTGTIASDQGAGEVIRATSRAGFLSFSCRIVALG